MNWTILKEDDKILVLNENEGSFTNKEDCLRVAYKIAIDLKKELNTINEDGKIEISDFSKILNIKELISITKSELAISKAELKIAQINFKKNKSEIDRSHNKEISLLKEVNSYKKILKQIKWRLNILNI